MKRKETIEEKKRKKEEERGCGCRWVGGGWVRLSESIKSRGTNREILLNVRFSSAGENNGYFGMVEDLLKREKENKKKIYI